MNNQQVVARGECAAAADRRASYRIYSIDNFHFERRREISASTNLIFKYFFHP